MSRWLLQVSDVELLVKNISDFNSGCLMRRMVLSLLGLLCIVMLYFYLTAETDRSVMIKRRVLQ